MLFNKRDCACGMMGQNPFMQQDQVMPQGDFDDRDCLCGMMGPNPGMQQRPMMMQNPSMQQGPMMMQGAYDAKDCGCPMDPIVEAPIEKCIRRDICHDVQHVCPVHTKIINNHICRHIYVPQYSCSEENVVTNLDQGSCCNFM